MVLARGHNQQQIAVALFISPKTVATHIQHILRKLDVHSRAEAVALAHRERLTDVAAADHPSLATTLSTSADPGARP